MLPCLMSHNKQPYKWSLDADLGFNLSSSLCHKPTVTGSGMQEMDFSKKSPT